MITVTKNVSYTAHDDQTGKTVTLNSFQQKQVKEVRLYEDSSLTATLEELFDTIVDEED